MEKEYDLPCIEEQIKYWQSMKTQHLAMNREEKRKANTQALLNQVYNVTPENSMRERLHSTSHTVPIIDAYIKSDKAFLLIDRAFSNFTCGRMSLIICKSHSDVELVHSRLTMTDLKQSVGTCVDSYLNLDIYKEKGFRTYEIYKAILESLPEKKMPNERIPFKLPIQFNAQGSHNRTGYGNEYNGDMLMHEGTNYGETTTFAIIGVILE